MIPAYRAAIALNNLAGRLMEQGRESEAVATFRDAVAMLQASCQSRTASGGENLSRSTIDEQVHRALQRLAVPPPLKRSRTVMSFSSVSDDSDFTKGVESVLGSTSQSPSPMAWLIRIEEYGSEGTSQRDFDLDSAIILHNYGLSCLHRSLTISNMRAVHKLRFNALKLIHWSHTVLSARTFKSNGQEFDGTGEKVLFISIVVTRSMAQALYRTSQAPDKVERCLLTLERLKLVGRELGFFDRSILIAAAAA
jgi:hypothetical protein